MSPARTHSGHAWARARATAVSASTAALRNTPGRTRASESRTSCTIAVICSHCQADQAESAITRRPYSIRAMRSGSIPVRHTNPARIMGSEASETPGSRM